MQETAKTVLAASTAVLAFLLSSKVVAKIKGNCSECHTVDQQGGSVGDLRLPDCVSCHAMGTARRIVTLPDGTLVPQVLHYDTVGDLAGGNFRYILEDVDAGPMGSRKGHDVFDLFPGVFTLPPGFIHKDKPAYFQQITCAGMNGCHGIRNQMMVGPGGNLFPRVGMTALQGAHHANVDGPLYSADTVADSFRFLMGVVGLEHTYVPDLYQNVTPTIHNEYYGSRAGAANYRLCSTCHVGSPKPTLDSYITAPRNSMSGFCATCHSDFHSKPNSVGLAFLRHPVDFVIPNRGEYAKYTTYEVTAPVARPTVYEEPSDVVIPGQDMVMCLSCHVAHASPYDGMLRFDFREMIAGYAKEGATGTGCLACHTSKGRRRKR
jgi:hypothetical protein